MNCPDCGYANPDDAGFCGECGASLARDILCPNCGRQNPARQKFCHGCGQRFTSEPERDTRSYTPKHLADKILQSKSALEGERKQVTVLFADITGSMALAGQVDPEEWHSILDRYFQIASDGVHRFEGTVNQYTGDGIMALFGAPIAHEDHAQRACYAALRLREELKRYAEDVKRRHGLGFSFRLGLNSGDVVVGKIGDDLRMDYTAQGVTVGLAERMEQLAAADSAYVSDATARLVQGYFELRDLDEFSLKGVREPVRVHELQGVGALRTRLDASRARGFSKFVGRDRELASLESALEEAIAGNGQVVGIVADAGTGKSRLCAEFVEQCLARGIRVNQAHCPAHGKTIPYLPLLEMLRDIFDIDERDSDHEARRKITGELMLLDDRFRELLPLLFDFLGVPDPERPAPNVSPEGRQQQLFAFVRHLSQARSEREPAVIFLDDLHWIDPGSDAFLAHAVEGAPGTRTLYLVNFRPEYHAEWMKKSFYRQLPLQPLGREAIEELLADLLGSDLSVAALPARIHERTGGNPFFIEEVVQSLVEGGNLEGERGGYRLTEPVEMLEIPGTVQSVLAARIDRLAEQEKQLLQRASVINKEFAEPILKRVAELPDSDLAASLSALVLAEFLLEKALYPEAEYAFKHPLTQEVAYHSQLAERRAALHAAVARAVEEIDADRLDERAALLGYHWEEAGEPPAAARWYARAARSAGVATPVESLRHWEKVWAILDRPPTSEEASSLLVEAASELLQLGYRQGVSAERAEAIYDEGRQLADRADVTESVKLRYGYGVVNMLSGNLRRAVAVLEEGVALADPTGDPELRFGAREPLWAAHAFLGDLEAALRVNAEKIEIAGKRSPRREEHRGVQRALAARRTRLGPDGPRPFRGSRGVLPPLRRGGAAPRRDGAAGLERRLPLALSGASRGHCRRDRGRAPRGGDGREGRKPSRAGPRLRRTRNVSSAPRGVGGRARPTRAGARDLPGESRMAQRRGRPPRRPRGGPSGPRRSGCRPPYCRGGHRGGSAPRDPDLRGARPARVGARAPRARRGFVASPGRGGARPRPRACVLDRGAVFRALRLRRARPARGAPL